MATFESEENCLKVSKSQVWKFVHHKDYKHYTPILKGRHCSYNWLEISDGWITVKGSFDRGYAWDGCTPKINKFQITWGNFDGMLYRHDKADYKPYTYYASMIHDVLYQYKRCAPITRKEADLIFYDMLKNVQFRWAWHFYAGVRCFGWIYSGWKYKKL